MKAEVLNQLTWEDLQEITKTANATLRELDTCPDNQFPKWSDSSENAFKEVLRRLKEQAKDKVSYKEIHPQILTVGFEDCIGEVRTMGIILKN